MKQLPAVTLLMALTLTSVGPAWAFRIVPSPSATCSVFDNAKVWQPGQKTTPTGLEIGPDGTIVRVGKAAPTARKCAVVSNSKPLVVTPGLVETTSSVGLTEIWLEDPANDASAVGRKAPVPVRASYRAFDAYNPRSTLIPVARAEGVTHVLSLPRDGLVSGQAPLMRLRGRLQKDAAVNASAAMVVRLGAGAGSRGFKLQMLRNLLSEARRYLTAKGKKKGTSPLPAPVGVTGAQGTPYAYYSNLEALSPVLTAAQPLLAFVERASDIEALLRLQKEFGFKLVIAGAAEGWLVAKELAAAKVPVILDPLRYAPGSFDQIHARVDNPKRLVVAGVPVILGTFATHDARRLRYYAGNAVRGGLTRDQALRAITWTPQEAFGLPKSAIRVGDKANLAVWDGDPLEPRTSLVALWIDGHPVSLDTRHKQLMRRYKDKPQMRGLSN